MAFAWFAWQHPQEQPPEHNLKGFLGLIETRFQPPKCVHKRCQLVAIVQSYSDLYIFLFISCEKEKPGFFTSNCCSIFSFSEKFIRSLKMKKQNCSF